MSRSGEAFLDRYGTEGIESTPGIEALAQRIPPDTDPDGLLQWSIQMMGYAYLYGNEALKRGGRYQSPHPQYESAPKLYRRFLERVEASMVAEQKEAAE